MGYLVLPNIFFIFLFEGMTVDNPDHADPQIRAVK